MGRVDMETEDPDDSRQKDASEVWEHLSEDQRKRVVDLLTRMAYRHVKSQSESVEDNGEGEPSGGSTR